jgi:gliding motility-associated-like protein
MVKQYKLVILALFALFNSSLSKAQTANFTFTPQSGCDIINVSFTDASTGASSWLWRSNGVQFSTLQNPSNIFTTGTYVISLIINGGVDTAYDTIYVYQSPSASFTTISDTTCAGVATQFTSTSVIGGGPFAYYIWTWGDGGGDTVTTDTTSHVYMNGGQYSANLVVYDVNGCHSQSVPHTIYVYPAPVAQFSFSPASACTPPVTVTFSNSSTGISYSWNFGDPASGANNTSSLTNPTHTYNSTGTYTITLTATTGSCSSTITHTFYLQPEAASFTQSNDTICRYDTVYFNNTSIPPSNSVSWNFGDPASGANNTSNLFAPFHVFHNTGTFVIQLIATANNCTDTTYDTVYVRPQPIVSFSSSDSTNCSAPWQVNFFGVGNNIATWVWDFGDGSAFGSGQNPSHVYTSIGIIDSVLLYVTDIYGCKDTVVHYNDVQIIPPSISLFNVPDSGCVPLTVFFQATTSVGPGDNISTITWDFGDGSPPVVGTDSITHIFNYVPPGSYTITVTMTTTDGCSVSASASVIVGFMPTAISNHLPDTVCYGDPVLWWSTSTPNITPITAYNWSFGSIDSAASMSTLPYDTGWVQVILTVYSNGCADTARDSVYILGPIPRFTVEYDCDNRYTVLFEDTSVAAEWIVWDFGDGTPRDSTNTDSLYHTYPIVPGQNYTATLTAYNFTTGCSYSISQTIQIRDAQANPSASPPVGCYPFNPLLVGINSQDAVSYAWNFDDPSSGTYNLSNWPDTFHLFADTGYYNVQLIVADLHGCVDTEYVQVQVNGPYASFTADSMGCKPFNAGFYANADVFPTGTGINTYYWNFNYPSLTDTATVTTPNTTHLYDTGGVYTIQLIVTDANGCQDVEYHTGYIQVFNPYPSFSVDTFICSNTSTSFTGNVLDIPGSSPYTYVWNFGDGSPLETYTNVAPTSHSVTHTYTVNPSVNTITLIVTDSQGCTDTSTVNITVLDPVPPYTVTASDSCGYTHVQFTSPDTTYNYAWQWNITGPAGYSATSFNQNPFFNFTVSGTYNTTLTVTNPGCTASVPISGIVVSHPEGHFTYTPDTRCPPVPITFTTTLNNNVPYDYILWNFGDGNSDTTFYPGTTYTYTYYTVGTFMPNAQLAYTLPGGETCEYLDTNIVGVPIVVTPGPTVDITQDSIVISEGEMDTLTSTYFDPNNSPPYTYTWTVNPDQSTLPIFGTTSAVYTADSADAFIVLILTDANGCQAWDTVPLIIRLCEIELKIPNVFTPNGDNKNDTYYIDKLCPIEDFDIKIFNRWGNVVYQSHDYDFAWDGKDDNGKECSDGTYYYVLRAKRSKLHGYIQLIRDKNN